MSDPASISLKSVHDALALNVGRVRFNDTKLGRWAAFSVPASDHATKTLLTEACGNRPLALAGSLGLMTHGQLLDAAWRMHWKHGATEVRCTFGCGIRDLRAELKRGAL